MTDAEARYRSYVAALACASPPVHVVHKGAFWHQRVVHELLRVLTFGGQNRYLTSYVTTLGHTIYVPDDWEQVPALQRYVTLRHEVVHVRQFERFGWLGMVLLYGLLPFPVGLAYGRALLEWEAYTETLRATAETFGYDAACDPALHDEIVARFVGPDYAWMWPFPSMVRGWIVGALAEIAPR